MEVIKVDDVKSLEGKDSIKNEIMNLILNGKLKTIEVEEDEGR